LLHELLALALPTEILLKVHAHRITFYLQSTIVPGESLGVAFLMLLRSFKRQSLKTQNRRPIVN
jgi:hypothetical protein